MQKIMFDHRRFGLEQAVIDLIKTMTRRLAKLPKGIEPDDVTDVVMGIDEKGRVYFTLTAKGKTFDIYPKYQIGEEVAIAKAYKDIEEHLDPMKRCMINPWGSPREHPGWNNKMFTNPYLMPHRIRIKDIKLDRLQDISDEDCRKEGIIYVQWKQHLKQDIDDFSPQKYKLWDAWTLPKFKEGILDPWADSEPDEFMAKSPKVAFAVLIFKMMGKKVWYENPWVFAYTFELIK